MLPLSSGSFTYQSEKRSVTAAPAGSTRGVLNVSVEVPNTTSLLALAQNAVLLCSGLGLVVESVHTGPKSASSVSAVHWPRPFSASSDIIGAHETVDSC